MPIVSPFRWFAVGVFVLSSTLNYLDRSLLAVLAPLIMAELHFSQLGYGVLISLFSIVYAASSVGVGWFLDRVGVDRGMSAAVGWWSLAALSTGLVRSFTGLGACRAALAFGESAGIPAVGKINGVYLKPEERAFGAAVNQIGISLGATLAPLFIAVAAAYTWRTPFVISGSLGFVWIAIWLLVSRKVKPPETTSPNPRQKPSFQLLADPQLLKLVAANALWMPSYSLWTNWTSLYLIHVQSITLQQSAHYVWIPPLISNLGGFFGGWLSFVWMRRAVEPVKARRRAVMGESGRSFANHNPSSDAQRVLGHGRHLGQFFLRARRQRQRLCFAHRSIRRGAVGPGNRGSRLRLWRDANAALPRLSATSEIITCTTKWSGS